MMSGHTLAKNLRQWSVVFGSGLAGLALGLILFGLYGVDGIFRALSAIPPAVVAVAFSLVLALAFMAGGALFAVAQERWRPPGADRAQQHDASVVHVRRRRPARFVQRALYRNVQFAA